MSRHLSLAREQGSTIIEYVLMLAIMAIGCFICLINVGDNPFSNTFYLLSLHLDQGANQTKSGGGSDEGTFPFPDDPGGANDPRD